MPVFSARSVARMAFTGIPRLYAAARRAGTPSAEAVRIIADSALVFLGAARSSPTRWREQNAIRHFTWQAWITATHGRQLAVAVAAAQERGTASAADSAVDRRNNVAGQEYGAAHADELTALGRRAAIAQLLATSTQLFRDGHLAREA